MNCSGAKDSKYQKVLNKKIMLSFARLTSGGRLSFQSIRFFDCYLSFCLEIFPVDLEETHRTAGEIVYKSLLFSLIMGFIGGVLPAARMNIVDVFWAS